MVYKVMLMCCAMKCMCAVMYMWAGRSVHGRGTFFLFLAVPTGQKLHAACALLHMSLSTDRIASVRP